MAGAFTDCPGNRTDPLPARDHDGFADEIAATVSGLAEARHDWVRRYLGPGAAPEAAPAIVAGFIRSLAAIRRLLDTDVVAAFRAAPAARGVDEMLLCYPGLRALINHRPAHRLYTLACR